MSLELASPTMPPGKTLVMNLQDRAQIDSLKKNPINIKEGVEYKCAELFSIVSSAFDSEPLVAFALTSRSTTQSFL